jgi:AraC-like DNA-binding protein
MAVQSLFLGLALIAQSARRSHANLALALASLAFAVAQGTNIVEHWTGDTPRSGYFWAASHLPILFIPPFAFLHIVGLTSGASWRFKLQDLRHGVFCLVACVTLAVAVMLESEFLAWKLVRAIFLITVLQGGYYLLIGLRLTRQADRPQIAWLRLLLLGLTAFLLLFAAMRVASILLGNLPWMGLMTTFTAFLVLYGIAWASLTHGKAFSQPPGDVLHALIAPLGKYRRNRQSAEDAERILGKLDRAIQADALYRDANLTLPMLSAKIGATPNVVSQALNETLGVSFSDYINGHRIDEAKRRLLEIEEDSTILDVAYRVGFNAKSTFNTAFKKHTGQTPSLYKKQSHPGSGI